MRHPTGLDLVILSLAFTAACAPARSPDRVAPSSAAAPRWTPATIDGELERLMAAAKVPGLALALIDDGVVVYERAYGVADREAGVALRTDSVMAGASLTKAA